MAMDSVEIMIEQQVMDREALPASALICRICLKHDADSGNELIAPCECKGSSLFVHRSCLDHWRSVKEGFSFAHCTTCKAQFHLRINFLEGSRWRKTKFRMLIAGDVILVFLITQMIIAMLGGLTYLCDRHGSLRNYFHRKIPIHPVLFYYFFGVLLYLVPLGFAWLTMCLSSGENEGSSFFVGPTFIPCLDSNSCSDTGDDCLIVVLILFIIFGIFIGIFAAIIGGIFAAIIGLRRIIQKHYHILTKRELTKEFVVEDLHGHYTPPNLDREHEERLRTLKLL